MILSVGSKKGTCRVIFTIDSHKLCSHTQTADPPLDLLAAPAGAAATPAPIARTVPRHDAAAEAAGGSVAQVDDAGQLVGGVHRTRRRPLVASRWPRTHRSIHLSALWQLTTGHWPLCSQILEQELLLASEEAQLEPAEDV